MSVESTATAELANYLICYFLDLLEMGNSFETVSDSIDQTEVQDRLSRLRRHQQNRLLSATRRILHLSRTSSTIGIHCIYVCSVVKDFRWPPATTSTTRSTLPVFRICRPEASCDRNMYFRFQVLHGSGKKVLCK